MRKCFAVHSLLIIQSISTSLQWFFSSGKQEPNKTVTVLSLSTEEIKPPQHGQMIGMKIEALCENYWLVYSKAIFHECL